MCNYVAFASNSNALQRVTEYQPQNISKIYPNINQKCKENKNIEVIVMSNFDPNNYRSTTLKYILLVGTYPNMIDFDIDLKQ